MAALVQTYPQQTGTTLTMLQTRPNSASAMQGQSQQQYMNTAGQRNSFHGLAGSGMGTQSSYRGSPTTAPIQPYAFTSTPSLSNGMGWQPPQQPYGAMRASSSPSVARYNGNSMPNVGITRDDSSLPGTGRTLGPQGPRPHSTYLGGSTGQPTFAQVAASKASPERYRRPARQQDYSSGGQSPGGQGSAVPSGSGMATVVHLYNPRATPERKVMINRNAGPSMQPNGFAPIPGMSADDIYVNRAVSQEEIKRFRRRSMHSFDATDYPKPLTPQELKQQAEASLRSDAKLASAKMDNREQKSILKNAGNSAELEQKPPSREAHSRSGSSDSLTSSRSNNSRPSSANRATTTAGTTSVAPTPSPASLNTTSTTTKSDEQSSAATEEADYPKLVNIPPRSSSSDVGKRAHNPSPLSKPATMATDASAAEGPSTPTSAAVASSTKPPGSSHGSVADSPAAKQLAAINEKGNKSKNKTSRLRRAFSFGSAADFNKAATNNAAAAAAAADSSNGQAPQQNEPSKLHKDPRPEDVYEEEQARIAKKQEEGGIGHSIYSGTKLFSGSTDNLSISSTASSASIMLRKMGRSMKKGGRSLVGLFRPKSVIGVPAADSAIPEASQATVSMITVEAEREIVNVNPDVHAKQDGGTGFPRLERNSIDASKHDGTASIDTDDSGPRKSIVGGERERAEVLATIRKGILKTRGDSPSPSSTRGQEGKSPAFELPTIPNVADSPISTAPSTPNEDVQGHKRSDSIAIGNEDYFMSALRLRQDTKSAPGTPQGSISKRNATFSPRIVFYDTWPSGEYDRRGEIATCNRLTPMLAQQIKEELNSFKMEMEVHETSKIYTHFF